MAKKKSSKKRYKCKFCGKYFSSKKKLREHSSNKHKGKVCSYCGRTFGDEMPFVCKFCGERFCTKHRLPENHECEGLKEYKEEVRKGKKPWFKEKWRKKETKERDVKPTTPSIWDKYPSYPKREEKYEEKTGGGIGKKEIYKFIKWTLVFFVIIFFLMSFFNPGKLRDISPEIISPYINVTIGYSQKLKGKFIEILPGQEKETQVVNSSCIPKWECGGWSPCENGIRTRECHDRANCGTTMGRPVVRQECGVASEETPRTASEKSDTEENSRFSHLKTGRKTVDLTYFDYVIYKGVNDYLAGQPRTMTYYEYEPTTKDFILRDLNNEVQMEFLMPLVEKIESEASDKKSQADIAIRIVQNIPYDWDGFRSGNLTARYPYEVLYDYRGVCGEKSELLAFLLRELNFDVVIFEFKSVSHRAVGIECEDGNYNTDYCFIETTEPYPMGEVPNQYVGGVDISGLTPQLIRISQGISYN